VILMLVIRWLQEWVLAFRDCRKEVRLVEAVIQKLVSEWQAQEWV
jgi:hypothetical protein